MPVAAPVDAPVEMDVSAAAVGSLAPVSEKNPLWALIYVDGDTITPWRTDSVQLEDGHIVSVSRGPVRDAVDAAGAFRATFRRPLLPADEFRRRLATPPPPLRLLTVRDLVPPEQRPAYDGIVEAQSQGTPLRNIPARPPFTPMEPPPTPKLDDMSADPSKPPDWLHAGNGSGQRRMNDPFGAPTEWNYRQEEQDQGQQRKANGKEDEEECVIS